MKLLAKSFTDVYPSVYFNPKLSNGGNKAVYMQVDKRCGRSETEFHCTLKNIGA